jgi:hypothetical protein
MADAAAGGEGHGGEKKQTKSRRLGDVNQINSPQVTATGK